MTRPATRNAAKWAIRFDIIFMVNEKPSRPQSLSVESSSVESSSAMSLTVDLPDACEHAHYVFIDRRKGQKNRLLDREPSQWLIDWKACSS